MALSSYALGRWVETGGAPVDIFSAVTGNLVAQAASGGFDTSAVLRYAREVGGPALRRLTFHQRADLLKKIAVLLSEHKNELYALSAHTGATKVDSMIDIDGGHVRHSPAERGTELFATPALRLRRVRTT